VQILDLNFLLKRDMADGVPLLAQLVSEVPTVTTSGWDVTWAREKCHSRLSFKHLNLALQSSTVILSRTFEVVVHPLDVGHKIGKVRPFHC